MPTRFAALTGVAALVLLASTLPGLGADESTSESVPIERWLVLGPAPIPLPAFHDAEDGDYDFEDLLDDHLIDLHRLAPDAGDALPWFDGKKLEWTGRRTDKEGRLELGRRRSESGGSELALLVAYLHVDRWTEVEFELPGTQARRIWLDGESVAAGGFEDADDDVDDDLELTPGHHRLLIVTVRDPERDAPWQIGMQLESDKGAPAAEVRQLTSPQRFVELTDATDPPRISSLSLAPDGSEIALSYSRVVPGSDDSEVWIERRRADDGSLIRGWREAEGVGQVRFSPDGRWLSYVADRDEEAATLFVLDTKSGLVAPLLDEIDGLSGYSWSPDSKTIVYSVTIEAEEDDRGVKLVAGMMDRWADFRDKSYLNLVTVPDGARRRLTAGSETTSLLDLSPDGKRLLFSRQIEDLSTRPYSYSELWELDLATAEPTKLREFRWLSAARWAPDGKRLLIQARPNEFGDQGVDSAEGLIPNGYDSQLFIWAPGSDKVQAISKDFDPSIIDVVWSRYDGRIYLRAAVKDYNRLFRYDPERDAFAELDGEFDAISGWTLAEAAPVAVAVGDGVWRPEGLALVDLTGGAARALQHPGDDYFADLKVGTVEPFVFTAKSGRQIDGRVYYPPGFDSARKYPAIVYYYGGTVAVTRNFAGRYPKEWWASNGYVVYVPQLSGAIGYGQNNSALHVNDWGKTTSEELIQGTEAFLEAHDFVDPDRVGAIGASFGGFMTMLVITRSDIFAAAVSHAGISSIASYWGEGYWGYSYNSVSAAESFPWNRPDVYVEQSPLFRADKVQVPLLLTHGNRDRNVPVGESDAFFAALRMQGKPVEYLQVDGQDHWILEHDKRLVWSNTILAWFDRWLKDQPEWWDELYD